MHRIVEARTYPLRKVCVSTATLGIKVTMTADRCVRQQDRVIDRAMVCQIVYLAMACRVFRTKQDALTVTLSTSSFHGLIHGYCAAFVRGK